MRPSTLPRYTLNGNVANVALSGNDPVKKSGSESTVADNTAVCPFIVVIEPEEVSRYGELDTGTNEDDKTRPTKRRRVRGVAMGMALQKHKNIQ